MLYSSAQFGRDQLLTDLIAVRDRLKAGWHRGGFVKNGSVCIVAGVQKVTGEPVGFTVVTKDTTDQSAIRMGRALVAIYMALYGPKAPQDVTLSQVMTQIAGFNDGAATHASVMLLLDRAIAQVVEHAGATVSAQAG